MYGLKKRSKQDESGLIQGAGTGTSDSIKKSVPAGSYIMPADSTKQIGANNLKNMGSPTAVNLSNGEFQLPPEQVHQVGVQTLDAMKDQTHMSVNQPQLGFKPGQNKPELFFANGGVVPDEDGVEWSATDKAKAAVLGGAGAAYGAAKVINSVPSIIGSAPNTPTTAGQVAKGVGRIASNGLKSSIGTTPKSLAGKAGVIGALGVTALDTATTPTEQYRERFGLGAYDPDDSNGMLFAKDLGVRALGAASDLGNNMTLGLAGKFYQDKQNLATQPNTTPPTTKPDAKVADTAAKAAEKAKADTAAQAANNTQQPSDFPTTQQPIGQQQNSDPYAIQQKGNSFSYANPGAAAEARAAGVPELQSSGIQTGRGIRGVNEFMANTRKMGPSEQQIQNAIAQREMNIGMQGFAGTPKQPERPVMSDEEKGNRAALARQINSAIDPGRGPTAKQAEMLLRLSSNDPDALDIYKTDANNAAALQREAMGQAGQNYRTELNEQGTNNRFNANLGFDAQKFQATNDLANREFNLNATEKGFGIRNSARLEKLYEQLDAAKTDEDRKSIQEKINRYDGGKGNTGKDRFMTVGGGQQWDDKAQGTLTQPQRLFDTQTQQFVDTSNQNQQSIPQAAIEYLRKNPDQANYFNEMFGAGASDKYLKG
ncbi:hypothetical protein [Acinetobacter sp. CIP 102129]|uniref:hypothetical protein n=1 Tax=Acinetobacter sp. CIP 102129 TaxID=1144664 RepID=UPI0002CEFBD3|nr:hypothetical protein [Acinetobacter sp. CIP 102129]ENU86118.1 hypothetical protein F973_01715 [Acinetobacter sp. CIP 102129]